METLNTVKSEHLPEKKHAISACLCRRIDEIGVNFEEALFVDYYGNQDYLEKNRISNNQTSCDTNFVISPCDMQDKYSDGYRNCVGYAVVGTDIESGIEVSILSHIVPDYFRKGAPKNIKKYIQRSLLKVQKQCCPRSIDMVLFGGRLDEKCKGRDDYKEYADSMNIISDAGKKSFGFRPPIVVGPSHSTWPFPHDQKTLVFLDTQNRRLIHVRHESSINSLSRNGAALVSEIKSHYCSEVEVVMKKTGFINMLRRKIFQ